jgi:hypothetical protein
MRQGETCMPWSKLRFVSTLRGETWVAGVYSQAVADKLELAGFRSDSPVRQEHYLPADMPAEDRARRTAAAIALLQGALPTGALGSTHLTADEVTRAIRTAGTLTDLAVITAHVPESDGHPLHGFENFADLLKQQIAVLAPADVAEQAADAIDRATNQAIDALIELIAIPSTLPTLAQEATRSRWQRGNAHNPDQTAAPSSLPPGPPPRAAGCAP